MTDDETRGWLERIESRLSRLEGGTDKKVVMDERTEIEKEGSSLGGIETAKENDSIVKTKRVPVCDHCGDKLGDDFAICQKDGKKLCRKKCAIKFRSRTVCPQDLRSALPLSRTSFKVLLLIGNDIQGAGDIHRMSGIPKGDIGKSMEFLSNAGYTERSGLFRTAVTEMGLEALTCYGQLYGGDADMVELDDEVREFVLGQK